MNVYYRYWGKAQAKEGDTECHLLAYHNLDVAAVGWLLLAPDKPVTQRLAAQLDLASERLRQLLVFWLGQHDIGKFSRAFQGLFQPISNPGLVPPAAQYVHTERHYRLGADPRTSGDEIATASVKRSELLAPARLLGWRQLGRCFLCIEQD